jgi:hypothetical protein
VQRSFLAAAAKAACFVVVLGSVLEVGTVGTAHAADPRIERDAQALQKKAIEEDNLNVNYPAAIQKLRTAIAACGTTRCGPALRAALVRDLGAMQVLNGNTEDGKANFAQALTIEPATELDPAYKNPQLEQVFAEVKRKLGSPSGPGAPEAPAAPAPSPGPASTEFVHTPPVEALLRTPLAIYAEYAGQETIARVAVKYRSPGSGEWRTLELARIGTAGGWGGLVPCRDVGAGTIQYYIQGFNPANDPVIGTGSRTKPLSVPVKGQISGTPPSLPGQEPPKPCPEPQAECPPDFPGCKNRKDPGAPCAKDAECSSSMCVAGRCAEKLPSGAECEREEQCDSGWCSDGKCTSGKRGEGEDCETDNQCEIGACADGKCSASAGFPRVWLGVGASMDFFVMPGTSDVCLVNSKNQAMTPNNPYICVDPKTSANFPDQNNFALIASNGDAVRSGFAVGNLRLLASFDYALSPNFMLGLRAGYELFTNPASNPGPAFTPIHAEARATVLLGKNAIAQRVAPVLLVAAGVGEFDAFVSVPVFLCPSNPTGMPPAQCPMPSLHQQQDNAWLTAGPGFVAAGGGLRVLLSKKVAATGNVKLEAAFGGTAGALFGIAPELGIQFGL